VAESFASDTWNPAQYDKFQREREQPFFDLLALVRPVPGMRVIDLGCGTGRLTRLLHVRLQARDTLGLDRSARMLASANDGQLPEGLRFELGTIESFAGPDRYDLVFSNAAFHWVDDHESLIGRLAEAIVSDGQLAFQVPASHDEPSHRIAEELTTVEPYQTALAGWHRSQPVLRPDEYARIMYRSGFAEPRVQLTVYPHVLSGPENVVEWMKGSLLTEYERHLTPEMFSAFVSEYGHRLLERLGTERPYFFPFKRILCWGQKHTP
jgi:trans-aconitate 2-methyltransferase